MTGLATGFDSKERRRHLRCEIKEPVLVVKDGGKCDGVTIDMSVGGAAIKLDEPADGSMKVGDEVSVFIIPARVTRLIPGGVAVEFHIDPEDRKHLAAALMRLINSISPKDS